MINIYNLSSSEGGFFKAHLNFPKEYPSMPPKLRFISEIWHPNGESTRTSTLLSLPDVLLVLY